MLLQEHEIPTIVIIKDPSLWELDVSSSVVYGTTDSGTVDVFMDYSLYKADFKEVEDTYFEYLISELKDSLNNISLELQIDDLESEVEKLVIELFLALKNSFSYNIDTEWYLTDYQRKVLDDTLVNFRVNIGTVLINNDLDVDMYISAAKYFKYPTDIYCTALGSLISMEAGIDQASGRLVQFDTDIYSSGEENAYLNSDIYNANLGIAPSYLFQHCCSYDSIVCSGIECSGICTYSGGNFCASTYTELLDLCSTYFGCVYEDLDYCISTYSGTTYSGCDYENLEYYTDFFPSGIPSELIVSPGGISFMNSDIFSTKLGLSDGITSEIKTRSLFTGDFFINQDRFTTASSIAWVDVVDYLYPINTDKTFLYVDDVLASGIYFDNIPNGKRIYYDPLDDFYTNGVLTYTIHTENTIGEVEDKDFYLLFGYDLKINEVLNWEPNENILIRAEAQNLVFCPGLAGEAYDFTTVDLESINLKCLITPVGFVDLNFKISPQSTVFYYGKTYTVKLKNVKDFAGNTMPDLEYSFTIEDLST